METPEPNKPVLARIEARVKITKSKKSDITLAFALLYYDKQWLTPQTNKPLPPYVNVVSWVYCEKCFQKNNKE